MTTSIIILKICIRQRQKKLLHVKRLQFHWNQEKPLMKLVLDPEKNCSNRTKWESSLFVDWLVMIHGYVFDTDICNWSQCISMYHQYYWFPLPSEVLLFISCVHCILPKCALSALMSLLLIRSGLSGSVPFTKRLRINLETRPELATRKYLCKRHFAWCYHNHHM